MLRSVLSTITSTSLVAPFFLPIIITVTLFLQYVATTWAQTTQAPCVNPAERKEWRTLSDAEKQDWVDAFECLAGLPHDPSLEPSVHPPDVPPVNETGNYYDDIVYLHMDLNHHIHFTGLFFPWHRWFVHNLELAFKTKCGYAGTMPYWDWTLDAPDFYSSPFWDHTFIGGWGTEENDFSVSTGAFSSSMRAYPTPHILRRQFNLRPFTDHPEFEPHPEKMANTSFTREEVDKVVSGFVGDYAGLQTYVEDYEGMHSAVHNIVGADLKGACPQSELSLSLYPNCTTGPKWSPNDPIFFLHHAMLDKIWVDWQHKHPDNLRAFAGGSVQMLSNASIYAQYPTGAPPYLDHNSIVLGNGLWEDSTIEEVLDTQGGYLCYVYI